MGNNKIDVLIEFTHDDDAHTRALAIAGLAKVADPKGFNAVLVALFDPELEVRIVAASALELYNDSRAVEPLVTVALTDEEQVAINAIFALCAIEDSSAYDAALELFNKIADKDKLLQSLVSALGQRAVNKNCELFFDRRSQEKLFNIICPLYKGANNKLKASIIWTFGKFNPSSKIQKICEEALKSKDDWCVKYAIESLRNFNNPQSKKALTNFQRECSNSELQCMISEALKAFE